MSDEVKAPDKNTPAFPTHHNVTDPRNDGFCAEAGMSLRDWFAGQAITNHLICDVEAGADWAKANAKLAYAIADAMMEARK